MFNVLFQKYKIEVLKIKGRSLSDLQPYEKIFLLMMLASAISASIFAFCGNEIFPFISAITSIIAITLISVIGRTKKLLYYQLDNITKNSKERKILLQSILSDLKIDYNNPTSLEYLIEFLEQKKQHYSVPNSLIKAFEFNTSIILIPTITIVVGKILSVDDPNQIIKNAILVILISIIITIIVIATSSIVSDLFNGERKKLQNLIDDLSVLLLEVHSTSKTIESE